MNPADSRENPPLLRWAVAAVASAVLTAAVWATFALALQLPALNGGWLNLDLLADSLSNVAIAAVAGVVIGPLFSLIMFRALAARRAGDLPQYRRLLLREARFAVGAFALAALAVMLTSFIG